MKKVTKKESEELNKFIRMIEDDESIHFDFLDTGKKIPYIGWYWRDVDFSNPKYCCIGMTEKTETSKKFDEEWEKDYPKSQFVLALQSLMDNPNTIVGFMMNNKWGYKEDDLSNYSIIYEDMIKKLRAMKNFYDKRQVISLDMLQDFANFMVSLKDKLEFK